eukprot:5772649-Prymnesium_polylepis.1
MPITNGDQVVRVRARSRRCHAPYSVATCLCVRAGSLVSGAPNARDSRTDGGQGLRAATREHRSERTTPAHPRHTKPRTPHKKGYGVQDCKQSAKGSKTRVKLPKCVQKRFADIYGDKTGTPTKVGYKPA